MSTGQVLQKGPYIHARENIEEVRFASSGDLDRSFTILIADQCVDAPGDRSRSGIAVLDNDNYRIVLDGLYSDISPSSIPMMFRFANITSLSWPEFAEFCRTNPRYRGGIPDIDDALDLPHPGNLERQAALGLCPSRDMRSNFIRHISQDPGAPYTFPPMDREGMTAEICRHLMYVDPAESFGHIAWDIRMNMSWNRTGRLRGMPEMDSRHDADWRHTVESEPELIRQACADALSVYVGGPTCILEMEEYPCEFAVAGKRGGFLILKKFSGFHMCATCDVSMADRLQKLSDDQLEALWVACRVLDVDLSPESRRHEMEYQMHLARRKYEQGETPLLEAAC